VFAMMTTDGAQAMRRALRALRFVLVLKGQLDLRTVDELAAVTEVNVLVGLSRSMLHTAFRSASTRSSS
jgi:hypothetical protein